MTNQRNSKALPSTFIDKETVNERVRNYHQHKLPLLSAAIGKTDSHSAWYSLEQFEEMVKELHYQNASGLRIYFGAYSPGDLLYPNQLTLIFVPTHLENNGKHKDIIIDDDRDFSARINALKNMTVDMDSRKGLDSIGLCPPSCDDQDPYYPY